MCHNIFRSLILTGAVLGLFGGMAMTAQAGEVTDDAGFFSREAREKANARLADLKKETGKEVRIETVKAVPADKKADVAKMERAEKSKFFEKWARDRATVEHVKGIFVLICKDPGHVHVVVNKQTREQGFGVTDEKQLADKFLDGFKHKEYDKALADAVETVSQTVKKLHAAHASGYLPSAAAHNNTAAPHNPGLPQHNNRIDPPVTGHAGQPARVGGMGWLGWVIVAVVVFLGIRVISALFRGATGGGGYGGGPGPGYGGGYGAGGGGMMGNIMGGLFGAVAGNWLYHSFMGGNDHMNSPGSFGGGALGGDGAGQSAGGGGDDFQGSGGDFDDDNQGGSGGDFGDSGGDFSGGDSGGGDFGGGDFGGGDSGGGGGDF